MRTSTFVAVACIAVTRAHIALWDKAMFGMNYPNQIGDAQNYNNDYPVHPLRELDGLSKDQWFAHGYKGFPPKDGDFMVLPAGGQYTGEQACNRAETTFRNPGDTQPLNQYACRGGEGALHVMNKYNMTVDPKWFGGTALAIAYTSDVANLQPNDMTVISVVQQSVWTRYISYSIPAGLPACPPGGCLCTWNWIHRAGNGEGYPFEIYNLLYRCTVTGASSTNVVQRGQVPRDCTGNPSACVSGAKTPMYLYQADGNNLPHLDVPPMYNSAWGFNEGAQNDIFAAAAGSTPAPSTYIVNPYADTTTTGSDPARQPTATALPQGWQSLGCFVDQDPRSLNGPLIYQGNDVTISMGTSLCDKAGWKYAMIENGNEIWCGSTAKLVAAPASECNVRCKGDPFAFCGGPWRGNAFIRVDYEATNTGLAGVSATDATPVATATTNTNTGTINGTAPTGTGTTAPAAPSATPTEVLPAGWVHLGCSVDQDSPRALDRGAVQFANNTNPICANYCASKNFTYAGTEYGAECWCGMTSRFTAGTGCDKPCAGNDKTICGGGYRINIMQFVGTAASSTGTTSAATTTPGTTAPGTTAPGTTTPGTTAPGTTAQGTTTPGTTGPGTTAPGTTAPGTTAPGTTAPGTTAPGTTAPGTTAPGTTAPGTTTPGTTAPTTPPATTPPATTTPGTTSTTTTTFKAVGPPAAPSSSTTTTTPPVAPTTASPTTASSSTTTTFKAVGPPAAPTSSTTTTTTASPTASPTFKSTNVLPSGWVSLGCFADSYDRVMAVNYYRPKDNSPKYCINLCKTLGYKFAGVETRTDCGCSNSTAKLTKRLTTCTAVCPADSKSTCGNTWAIEVFSNTVTKLPRGMEEESLRERKVAGRRLRNPRDQ